MSTTRNAIFFLNISSIQILQVVLRISWALLLALGSMAASGVLLALSWTTESSAPIQTLDSLVHGHGSFSEVLANSLPLFNIEHLPLIYKVGDAEKGKSFKIDPGFISTDNNCEMCIRAEYTPASNGMAGFAYK